jgi:hypothetical protein
MCTVHAYQNTTAVNWRQCSNCRQVEHFVQGQWYVVESVQKKHRKRRNGVQQEMFDGSHTGEYSDHGKASDHLNNYWR